MVAVFGTVRCRFPVRHTTVDQQLQAAAPHSVSQQRARPVKGHQVVNTPSQRPLHLSVGEPGGDTNHSHRDMVPVRVPVRIPVRIPVRVRVELVPWGPVGEAGEGNRVQRGTDDHHQRAYR